MKVKKLSNKQIEKYAEEMDLVYLQPGTWYDFYDTKGERRELMFIATLYRTNHEVILAFLDKEGKQVTKTVKTSEIKNSKPETRLNDLIDDAIQNFGEAEPSEAYFDCEDKFGAVEGNSPIWRLIEEAIKYAIPYALSVAEEFKVIED